MCSKSPFLNVGDMGLKLKLGIERFRALTHSVIKKEWDKVGLWPMDFRFVGWAEENWKRKAAYSDEIITEGSERNADCVLEHIENLLKESDQTASKMLAAIKSITAKEDASE